MARITRKTQKVFAGSAQSDQITAFGTAKTSNPTYTTDVGAIQTATYEQGWTPSLMSDLAPYLQDSNALWYATTKQLAYLFQEGIAEWDSGTEYGLGSWVKYNKSIYESIVNNNINHQVSDTNYWQKADFSYGGLPVGTVFPSLVSSTFIPNGCVPCDGTEYSGVTFGDLFNNYLVTGKLVTCTYAEYQQDINTYGNCIKFGIDTVNRRFKVPTISNGTFIEQGVNNACYNAGLPNITGQINGVIGWGGAGRSGCFNNQWSYGNTGIGHSGDKHWDYFTTTFDASASSSIYNNNVNTVQPKAVELRYFVVISTGDLNKADMDWSEYIQNMQSFGKKDGSNLQYPYLKTAYVNGTAGYNIWSNGYCEQWGVYNNSSSNYNGVTITLTKPFANVNYSIYTTGYIATSDTGCDVKATSAIAGNANPVNNNSFLLATHTYIPKYQWKACGYLAEGQY